jgi:hypothetical protein
MRKQRFSKDFITDARIDFAVKLADGIAAEDRTLSAFECAEQAVRKVFGRWMIDHTGTVPTPEMPLFLRLVDEVEQRLGLHRRRSHRSGPMAPALARTHPTGADQPAAVA